MQNVQVNRRELLDESEVQDFLDHNVEWRIEDGALLRTIKFNTYLEGIDFVNRIAELAEEANHHPDLLVGWRKVEVSLSTHDSGGITQLDLDLAGKIDTTSLAFAF